MTPAANFEKTIKVYCQDLKHVSVGICPTCPKCACSFGMAFQAFLRAYNAGDIIDEGSFSWRACECCGEHLGGLRYTAHGRAVDGGLVHFTVCADCLQYLNDHASEF